MDLVDGACSDGEPASLLAMAELVKRFTGTLALDHVDFDVRRGEVHALLGQNGAVKLLRRARRQPLQPILHTIVFADSNVPQPHPR